jgi:hypothetical protein
MSVNALRMALDEKCDFVPAMTDDRLRCSFRRIVRCDAGS